MCVDKADHFLWFLYRHCLQQRPSFLSWLTGRAFKGSIELRGGGVCAIWPNSLKITQLFVCWYEYKFTACLCVCAHQAATLYSPSFLQPWTPSGHRCWRGPGFEPASLIVGCSARAAVHAATAAPQRASPSLRLVYCKVLLITPPSLHTLLLFVFWLSFRSLK